MPRRSRQLRQLSLAARFASGLYRERARIATAGYLGRDPMSLLKLRPGRENPYAVYDQLRAAGPLIWTRQGSWACTSYRGCDTVLRDRRSHLVAAGGEQLEPREMVPMCNLLLVAGFETTVNLISNAVLALLAHPGQWQALCADPEGQAPRVVEEVLHLGPPGPAHQPGRAGTRRARGPARTPGPAGHHLIGAANRDPEAYPDPDTFDSTRTEGPPHLAFATGIHYCLGHALARTEAAVALRLLATRMPTLTRSGPVRRRNTTIIRGPLHIPLTTGAIAPVPVS